jgi:hypothetical protein
MVDKTDKPQGRKPQYETPRILPLGTDGTATGQTSCGGGDTALGSGSTCGGGDTAGSACGGGDNPFVG